VRIQNSILQQCQSFSNGPLLSGSSSASFKNKKQQRVSGGSNKFGQDGPKQAMPGWEVQHPVEIDGTRHSTEVEGNEPTHKLAEGQGSNANKATHEVGSKNFIAKLCGPDTTAHEFDSRVFFAE
jgi:hypothetical protein